MRIRSLLAGLEPIAPEGLETELESARRAMGIGRRVRVGTHPEIAAPDVRRSAPSGHSLADAGELPDEPG